MVRETNGKRIFGEMIKETQTLHQGEKKRNGLLSHAFITSSHIAKVIKKKRNRTSVAKKIPDFCL